MSHPQDIPYPATNELLSTKLTLPRPHTSLVLRERLFDTLDEGLEHKLTLVSAPAGFGKTTLMSQWLHSNDERKIHHSSFIVQSSKAAWVALDAGDNDPVRFWRYALTAGQTFQADLGQAALDLLRTSPPPPFEALLTMVINELAQLPGRYVLVLEDYHLITSNQIHETLTFLLDHLPPTLHVIILTRTDPPFPLARLRAQAALSELRAPDLRFSQDEIEDFLEQTLPFSVSAEVISRLKARTEGWAAGLRLAALALQSRQAPQEIEQFLASFSGSHRPILEYLAEEVLDAQPESLQAFLLQTSILDRLCGSLCDAVLGQYAVESFDSRADSQGVLEYLERANLFLIPLDEKRSWYRYHALFAEAMQYEARRRFDKAALQALYERASQWYERQGLVVEAVESALSAQEFSRAAELIERNLDARGFNNEIHTQRRWLEQLPQETLWAHPALCFAYAVVMLFTSDRRSPPPMALVQTLLQHAEQGWQAGDNKPKLGQVLALRAMIARMQGDPARAYASARHALELLPEDDIQWRGVSLILVGAEAMAAGRMKTARHLITQARTLCEAAGNSYGLRGATSILGAICLRQGELHQADQIYRQILAETEEDVARGYASLSLATLAYEWNDLAKAEQQASQALEIAQRLEVDDLLVNAPLVLAQLHQARGETAQAQASLRSLIVQTKTPLLLRQVYASQARLALTWGDLASAQHWSTTHAQPDSDLPHIQQEGEALIIARLLIAQSETRSALRLLNRWQTEAHAQGRTRTELEIMVLTALAHLTDQNLSQAKRILLQVIAMARPEGYQRLFLDEGEQMVVLLRAVLSELQEEALVTYVQTLLATFADSRLPIMDGELNSWTANQQLVAPLSPQEQRVLRLLAAGLTNPEIAEELIVSINTVKTQVKSIYRKLDVHSRKEARKLAHRLKLL